MSLLLNCKLSKPNLYSQDDPKLREWDWNSISGQEQGRGGRALQSCSRGVGAVQCRAVLRVGAVQCSSKGGGSAVQCSTRVGAVKSSHEQLHQGSGKVARFYSS